MLYWSSLAAQHALEDFLIKCKRSIQFLNQHYFRQLMTSLGLSQLKSTHIQSTHIINHNYLPRTSRESAEVFVPNRLATWPETETPGQQRVLGHHQRLQRITQSCSTFKQIILVYCALKWINYWIRGALYDLIASNCKVNLIKE